MFFWVFHRRQSVIFRRFGTMYQFHLQRLEVVCSQRLLPAFEDGTDTWFRNVGKLHIDAGDIPKRTYTILCTCVYGFVLTLRLLMSYIYIYIYIYIYMKHLFLMFLDHTQRRSTVGRTPLDE